jgi:hypothetical protein
MRFLDQTIGEIVRHVQSFMFLQPMFCDQSREKIAIDSPGHVVAARN